MAIYQINPFTDIMATGSRIEISDKALKVLKMEAALMSLSQKETLEMMILNSASPEVMALVDKIPSKDKVIIDILPADMSESSKKLKRWKRPKMDEDAIAKLKEAWSRMPPPTYRELGREFGYAASTISYHISKLKESGEL